MNVNLIVWVVMIAGFLYTTGFVYALWKDNNKPGSIAIALLGLAILILPFLAVLKDN